MRKFELINSLGQRFNLTSHKCFFNEPEGLGLEKKFNYQKIDNYNIELSQENETISITGQLVFDGYKTYQEFAKFIIYAPFILVYEVNNQKYYVDVALKKLEKSEIDYETRRLICPIEFEKTSDFYKAVKLYRSNKTVPYSKKYVLRYPYKYSDNTSGSINIINNGNKTCPCRITFIGPVTNPSWQLLVHGKQVANGQVRAVIPQDHKLIIDSSPKSLEISEYDMNGERIRDLYGDSNMLTTRFIYLPIGNSILKFNTLNSENVECVCEVLELYDTI